MNQILATQNTKSNKQVGIKSIVRFFAISIMIFGLVLTGEGSYAIYRNIEDSKPSNIPSVTIERVNNELIISIQHHVEIMKIMYSWDNEEENVIPVNDKTAVETIELLGQNSILNLTVEDVNGKQVSFQKQYILEGVDITKPSIEIDTSNGSDKMTIIATDDTAISNITYQWDGEEPNTVYAETEGQKEIRREITLTPGTKTIIVTAEDTNGNIEELEKEIITSTSKPTMRAIKNGDELLFEVSDKDGVKDITINLNGERFSAKDINLKTVTVGPLKLKEGNNIISIEVTNVSGYTESAATELQYTPE